jgi:hypothetical protein
MMVHEHTLYIPHHGKRLVWGLLHLAANLLLELDTPLFPTMCGEGVAAVAVALPARHRTLSCLCPSV